MPGSNVQADCWINEYISPWDIYSHGVTRILDYRKTRYQDMYIAETGLYGKGLVLDGKWQSSLGDEFLYHEPLVHPGMVAHGAPKSALVLGGGEGATVREIFRWNTIQRCVMVDIDGEVVEACRRHLPEMSQGAFEDPRLELVIDDAIRVLETTKDTFDIIISDLSDPIEEGPSFALFTKEYFEKVRRALAPGGFFTLQSGPLTPFDVKTHAGLASTLRTIFPYTLSFSAYVPMYSASWSHILASSEPIEPRLAPPERVDAVLAERTKGGFRMFDGKTMLGMMNLPLYIRKAIATETRIFTLAAPPKFFGRGVAGKEEGE